LARRLLNTLGGFTGLYRASVEELLQIKGMGKAKAAQVKAALEIGKRFLQNETVEEARILPLKMPSSMQHIISLPC